MKVQLRRPFFPQKSIKNIQRKVAEILRNGQLTLGKNVETLELKFAKFQKSKYAVTVSSATAGLHISLLSLNVKKGDEVIVPAKTFISTANAAVYCNAKPVFCDVDKTTYQLDPTKIEKLITKRTKAIIPVHLGGNMCSMEEIIEIAKKYNLSIVEDCAHSHGSTLKKRKSGTFGDLGVFSFYPDKIMASADGGIIITDDYSLIEKLYLLRNVGRKKLGTDIFSEIGYNYRMNEIQALLALEQLNLLPEMIKTRQRVAKIYDSEISKLNDLKIPVMTPNVKSAYYAYILRLTKGNLNEFLTRLANRGIETSQMFISIYKHIAYEKLFGRRIGLCPISEKLDRQTFTIPLHAGISDTEVKYVISEIKKISK